MSKLKKLFKGITALLKDPSKINLVIDNPEIHKQVVHEKFPQFKEGLPLVDIQEFVPSGIAVSPYLFLEGGSMVTDLALLRGLARTFDNGSYFEIGTWRGESAANVANEGMKVTTLNLSADEIRQLGYEEVYINEQDSLSKNLENVLHIKGNSLNFDFSPYHGMFDLIFVDGDHHFEAVKKDTQAVLPLLKNEDSVIVWHDYAHTPDNTRWDVFRGILEGIPSTDHKHLYHVSNSMCAVYFRGKINTTPLKYKQIPAHIFDVNLQYK